MTSIYRMKALLALTILATLPLASAANADEDAAVIAVIDKFFAAMSKRDAESMRTLMTDDGILYGYRETADGLQIARPTHKAYLENLASGQGVPVERYWDPTIMIHDRLATVWTPYDFHNDGVFSHCGINNFSLLKSDDGWVITGVVFSMKSEGCEASPLGPIDSPTMD
jgi:hypothetical protein